MPNKYNVATKEIGFGFLDFLRLNSLWLRFVANLDIRIADLFLQFGA
jgi:hypothetical protein